MEKGGYIYILTNKNKTVLYTGVTSDLHTRLHRHRTGQYKNAFTSRYNVSILVYYEEFSSIEDAIAREKQIKGWRRSKKIALIESQNPEWRDVSLDWLAPR